MTGTTGLQRIPEAPFRVDTGPLKIGDDWAGFFVRGKAFDGFIMELAMCAELIRDNACGDGKLIKVGEHLEMLASHYREKMREVIEPH